jgi:hypothetical protein
VLRQFRHAAASGWKAYVCVNAEGETGWLDEHDVRCRYPFWDSATFARAVADGGFDLDEADTGPVVEV